MNNKYRIVKLSTDIKRNKIVRLCCAMPIIIKRKIDKWLFRYTRDYQFILKLKDKYAGERCVIIGNGPSLNEKDLDRLSKEITFASNRIYTIFERTKWRPTVYMCGDVTQMQSSSMEIPEMQGTIKLVRNNSKKYPNPYKDSFHYFVHDGPFFLNKEKLYQKNVHENVANSFSVSQSITCLMFELAFYMGFKEIYLIGVDHRFPVEINMDGKVNTRDVNQHFAGELLASKTKQNFCYKEALTKSYQVIKKYADVKGIKIYDATRNGELDVFDKISFDSVRWK